MPRSSLGPWSRRRSALAVQLQRELDGLVLPDDPVKIEQLGELPLRVVGEADALVREAASVQCALPPLADRRLGDRLRPLGRLAPELGGRRLALRRHLVDGGIDRDTVGDVVRAGAEILVAGNAVFGAGDPTRDARELLKTAREATLQKV